MTAESPGPSSGGMKSPGPAVSMLSESGCPTHAGFARVGIFFVQQNNLYAEPLDRLLRGCQMLAVGEQAPGAAVAQQLGNLRGVVRGVERDGYAAGSDDAQVGGDPARAVGGENGGAGAARHLLIKQPPPHRFCHPPQLGIGVALDRDVLPGDGRVAHLDGHVLRPGCYRLQKSAVEILHYR